MSRGLAAALFLFVLFPQFVYCQSNQPLTLNEALRAADSMHPELALAQAELAMAMADREVVLSRQDLAVNFEAGLRQAKPAFNTESSDFVDDHSVRLNAKKNIYDFGRTRYAENVSLDLVAAREQNLIDARSRRRIEIMARFFDVLLADMRAAAENEYRSITFVTLDNAKHRHELGLISSVQLGELQARDQTLAVRQSNARKEQRAARAKLASAMNRPGDLPGELVDPDLSSNNRPVGSYEELLPIMLTNNPRLKAQQNLLTASRARLELLRAESSPSLDAELEAGKYSRKLAARDELRAGVILNWPVYQGTRISAQSTREHAQFQKLQAELARLQLSLSQALLDTILEIEHLRKAARESAKVHVNYRDLVLERARGEYEMELKTNLGESMAATVEAKLGERKVEYQLALLFAELEALLGESLPAASGK